jgi:hypothetical protein
LKAKLPLDRQKQCCHQALFAIIHFFCRKYGPTLGLTGFSKTAACVGIAAAQKTKR